MQTHPPLPSAVPCELGSLAESGQSKHKLLVFKVLSHLQEGTPLTVTLVKPLAQLQALLTMVPSKLGLLSGEHTKQEPLLRTIAETVLSQTQLVLVALHT